MSLVLLSAECFSLNVMVPKTSVEETSFIPLNQWFSGPNSRVTIAEKINLWVTVPWEFHRFDTNSKGHIHKSCVYYHAFMYGELHRIHMYNGPLSRSLNDFFPYLR